MKAPQNLSDIACDMQVFSGAERREHAANAVAWRNAVVAARELEDGYRFELVSKTGMVETLARFVALESRCCPFFGFSIEARPEGSLAFSITGPPGAKELLAGFVAGEPARPAEARSG